MQTAASTHKLIRPVEMVRKVYVSRREKNPNYSLAAFARDLGMTRSLLSRVLSGSRPLTLKQALQVSVALGFSVAETNLLVLGVVESSSERSKISRVVRDKVRAEAQSAMEQFESRQSLLFVDYQVERFKAIAQWYHLAILNLSLTHDFQPDADWVAGRLAISPQEAREALDRLLELGFLVQGEDGRVRKSSANLYFKTERSESAIRMFHRQMIQKADHELKKTSDEDFRNRFMTGLTFSCPADKIDGLKKKIDAFQDELLAYARTGTQDEVYHLNLHLFPLTQVRNRKESV